MKTLSPSPDWRSITDRLYRHYHTNEKAASAVGVSKNTWLAWKSGKRVPRELSQKRMLDLLDQIENPSAQGLTITCNACGSQTSIKGEKS